jgi:hypothetical protein
MIVVQNATVGQFVASAKELYPNAKILTLEEADRSAEAERTFMQDTLQRLGYDCRSAVYL